MANRLTVAKSSDNDSDSDGIVVASSNHRTLKEVSIPVMTRPTGNSRKAAAKAESASPTDTTYMSGSTSRDGSVYDTPGTTPAASVRGAVNGAKRKRSMLGREVVEVDDSDEEMGDTDAMLARKLQEEEYAQEDGPVSKKHKPSRLQVADSEGSESELSEPPLSAEEEESDDDVPLSKRHASGGKTTALQNRHEQSHKGKGAEAPALAPRKGKKAAPPTRKARQNARRSIGSTLWSRIEDSDDELLPLSDSGDDFVTHESEAEETGASDTESDALLGASREESTVPGKRRKAGRRFGYHTAASARRVAQRILTSGEEVMLDRKQKERRKLEKAHPQIKTMWDDLEKIEVLKPTAAGQPDSINRKLKQFQLEGLNWMTRQEKTHYKGGLLGDEMGMGKTIQAVSLIMSDYPQQDPTLVVVPPVALMQWSTEIKEYTDGKLNVLVYHGQNSKIKGMGVSDLKKFDVIMISYNSLESLHRKETKGWSRGDDLVKEDSPIHAIKFHRLILDEAHSIKSRTTGVAKACFALQGRFKWCLSGTPVQNRIGEFFSLLRFLEVRPFADYFCKRCPCAILHWKLDEDHVCVSCKHSGMEHVSVFNQELLNPLTQSEDPAERSSAMDKLHMITARIMLRRMKRDYTSSMELPPKEVSALMAVFDVSQPADYAL